MSSTITALTSGGGLAMAGDTSGQLELKTNNGTTAVTVTTAQNVGIGTTTPTDDGGYGKIVDIYGSTGGALYLHTSTATNYAFLGKYNASTQLADSGSAGLTFATASGTTPVERMRITSAGKFLVGATTSLINNETSQFNAVGASAVAINATTGVNLLNWYYNGSIVAAVSTNGSTVTYATSSDYRLKEDIAPMTGALNKVSALKPVTYKWKLSGIDGQGFIAHELQAICPEAVVGEKDAVNEDGSIKAQGIDTSFLVATLTAAIQELNAKVDAQALEIQALKGVA